MVLVLTIISTNIDTIMSRIPGLSFSWKRALGVTAFKQKVARATGIPLTKQGRERKAGALIANAIFGKKRKW